MDALPVSGTQRQDKNGEAAQRIACAASDFASESDDLHDTPTTKRGWQWTNEQVAELVKTMIMFWQAPADKQNRHDVYRMAARRIARIVPEEVDAEDLTRAVVYSKFYSLKREVVAMMNLLEQRPDAFKWDTEKHRIIGSSADWKTVRNGVILKRRCYPWFESLRPWMNDTVGKGASSPQNRASTSATMSTSTSAPSEPAHLRAETTTDAALASTTSPSPAADREPAAASGPTPASAPANAPNPMPAAAPAAAASLASASSNKRKRDTAAPQGGLHDRAADEECVSRAPQRRTSPNQPSPTSRNEVDGRVDQVSPSIVVKEEEPSNWSWEMARERELVREARVRESAARQAARDRKEEYAKGLEAGRAEWKPHQDRFQDMLTASDDKFRQASKMHEEELMRMARAHDDDLMQLTKAHGEKLRQLTQTQHQELLRATKAHDEELRLTAETHGEELRKLSKEHKEEMRRATRAREEALGRAGTHLVSTAREAARLAEEELRRFTKSLEDAAQRVVEDASMLAQPPVKVQDEEVTMPGETDRAAQDAILQQVLDWKDKSLMDRLKVRHFLAEPANHRLYKTFEMGWRVDAQAAWDFISMEMSPRQSSTAR